MIPSLTAFYLDHIGEIRRFLARRIHCAETAADLSHEAFIRFLAVEDRQAIHNPRAFLFRIAENLAMDHFRIAGPLAGRRECIDDCTELPAAEPGPERYAIARQQLAHLQRAIEELPPRCKEVFLRHKFDGIAQKQLAGEYGVTLNAIEKLLIRALVHLRMRVFPL